MNTNTTKGYYGSNHTPCTIFTVTDINGGTWYVVGGSVNVNYTYEDVELGINVETLYDVDFFTASKPVESENDLLEEIEA